MLNSENSEKSRGILAFATNTTDIDYVSIAQRTLSLAGSVLNLPWTLVSATVTESYHNQRYSIDHGNFISWNNLGRYQAYELSPYAETLVIDADYLVLDDNLLKLFDVPFDYLLQRHSHALTQSWPSSMGSTSLPFIWATVFAFRKTHKAQVFFDLIRRIQENYAYYQMLFNVEQRNFRNDYAFAMADIILNGYALSDHSIPGSMLTIDQPITSMTCQGNSITIRDAGRAYVVPKTNMHVMSKSYLQSDNFQEFVDGIAP